MIEVLAVAFVVINRWDRAKKWWLGLQKIPTEIETLMPQAPATKPWVHHSGG
jgi:hypothetical protein